MLVSVSLPEVKHSSDKRLGGIGVDINADHLAITETDRFGNPIDFWTIPCCTYGKSSDQSRAVVSGAVKSLLAIASERKNLLSSKNSTSEKRKPLCRKKADDMRGCFHRLPTVSFTRL
ncbi:MAG: hypothetical protein ABR903_06080 [Thermodesulfovibrionales bacterium]